MSWTSPLTVARTIGALAALVGLLHVRFEIGHGRLHRLGRLRTNGSCISPEAKSSPTVFIPASRKSLTMAERRVAAGQGLVEIGLEAVAFAVDDPVLEAPLDRPARRGPRLDRATRRDPFEDGEELRERVVAVVAGGRR